jgi:sarcosine oxidase
VSTDQDGIGSPREGGPPGAAGASAGEDGGNRGPAAEDAKATAPPSAAGIDRRSFLRRGSLGAGTLAVSGSLGGILAAACAGESDRAPAFVRGRGPEVVVVGAGSFGAWTAYHLQQMGARVSLVDLYGPGNSRSTSGDETRGVRTAYGDRELWTDWARRSIQRWKAFDEEFARDMGGPVYFETGDLIFRDEYVEFFEQTTAVWTKLGIGHEVLDMAEVNRRWPQFNTEGMQVALYEPDAGVARARAAVQRVAAIVQNRGAELRIGRAIPGEAAGGRVSEVVLEGSGERVGGDLFVFALGPWFPKAFPEFMAPRMRIPMGIVFYYGPPAGDHRFSHPNLPSWGFPGVTGWPSLPLDQRGFRVRTGGRPGDDPDTSVRYLPEEYHEQARAILAERFPAMAEAPILETRACHYESTTTRDWIIDRHPGLENVWIAGGGNAEGFKFGPMLGELIAGRVVGNDRHPELGESFRLRDEDLAPRSSGD